MKLAAFLRGINVGGRHKVPMEALRKFLAENGCTDVQTVLNSGNVRFDTRKKDLKGLESHLEKLLSEAFGFEIPVILREKEELELLVKTNPFSAIELHKQTRCYVTLLKNEPNKAHAVTWQSHDGSFRIISVANRMVCSVLDLSLNGSPAAMAELEQRFGKGLTTRTWGTMVKMAAL